MINEICWILAIVVFLILEASASALISIWFAGGALAALIAAMCGVSVPVQLLVFLTVSVVCVILLRRVALKTFGNKKEKTNLDRIIGQEVLITRTVDNTAREGAASINDVEWKVKSENGEIIPAGETAKVTDIEGVKLIIKK